MSGRGPAEEYVRRVAAYRNGGGEHHDWGDALTGALVMTLIDWKVDSEMRPTFGEGSDCSDLMGIALTRIKALCSGEVDPETVMDEIEEARPTSPAEKGD